MTGTNLTHDYKVKTALAFLFLVIFVIGASALFRSGEKPAAQLTEGLPWQIESLPDGLSRIFGLVLTRSRLNDAREKFDLDMEIAVIAAPGESGALEAYSGNVTTGMITGKMILVADVDHQTLTHFRDRAIKAETMDGRTRKYILRHDDLALAWRSRIASITFIPAINLDEQTVLNRFGAPVERIRVDERVEHFLYPQQGLDLALDSKGKEVLQYVAPNQFDRLREPLIKATAATSPRP